MTRFRARWIAAAAAVALALPLGVASASGPSGDWPQADHDASANRASTTATQITPAAVAQLGWVRGLAGPPPVEAECGVGFTAPVIAGNRAYAATGAVVKQLWEGQGAVAVGDGHVVATVESRVLDVYGLPGS